MLEHTVLYNGITLQTWEEIKRVAEEYDVEQGSSPDHIFDARYDHIYIWGRDGWRDNYYHAYMWFDEETSQVRIARGNTPKSMSLHSARKFVAPMFSNCIEGESE